MRSEASGEATMASQEFNREKTTTDWTLRWRSSRDGSGWFLAFFFVAWIVGGILIAPQVTDSSEMPPYLPAVVAGVYGASVLAIGTWMLYALFGRKTLRLDGDGFRLEHRILFWSRSLQIPLPELRYFEAVFPTEPGDDDGDGEDLLGVRLVSLGPERLVLDGPREEMLTLLPEMNAELAALKHAAHLPVETPPEPVFPDGNTILEGAEKIETETIPLDRPALDIPPPSAVRWTCLTEFDRLQFRNRGRFQVFAVFMFLGITIFWNGIVSVFLADLFGFMGDAPEGIGWWALCLFLIPFEVAGVIFTGMLLLVSAEPFRATTLEFSRCVYSRRTTWFGLGWTRRRSLAEWSGLELRCHKSKKHRLEQARTNNMPFDRIADWRIVFLDARGAELAEIVELTEGEARWMADVLLREQRIVIT